MDAEEYAARVFKLPDRVAAVVGKTRAELGDGWDADLHLVDDEALSIIRDHLLDIDESLVERNKHKQLANRGGRKGATPEQYAVRVAKLPDRLAAVVGKTFVELGDAWSERRHLCEDTAVSIIRDRLNELDESLIPRNKNKRLTRR